MEGKCEIMSSLLILLHSHTEDPTTTSDHMRLPIKHGSQFINIQTSAVND